MTNTLENLSDEELLQLDSWMNTLTKRQVDTVINDYSTKFAYHVVRLALEAQQILVEHDLDVEVNREILKSIRRGEWSEEKLHGWFDEKEKQLEEMYTKSTLQHAPDEEAIKDLLMKCLEQHYGSLDQAVKREVPVDRMIAELKAVLGKYEGR
jgi:signal recognition particle GTPase